MYEEVITELKALKTVNAHLTSLGKLMNNTEDPMLKQHLDRLVAFLQAAAKSPNVKGKTVPTSLYAFIQPEVKSLRTYCEGFVKAKKPEWQVLAEHHGWTPPRA